MRGSEESRKARKRLGRIVRAISTLCFFLPRASTITSPVGGSEGGAGREEEDGAGEEGTGEEGRDGGGAGHGEGDTRGGESGDVMMVGFKVKVERDAGKLCGRKEIQNVNFTRLIERKDLGRKYRILQIL